MSDRGDVLLGDTLDLKFTTDVNGVPTTLAGSPVISAYVGNGTTEITAGITLSVDFDGRTGLHNVRVVASSGNGFAAATNVDVVITTGTVGGVSVVGHLVGSFSIANRSAVAVLGAPAGASVSADLAAVKVDTAAILIDTGTTLDARIPAVLVSGRMDSSVGAMAANTMTAAAAAADLTTELQTGLATAAALATVDGIVDDILVDTGITLQAEVDAIQAKTDNLPSDPADESLIIAATDAIMTRLGVAGAGLTAIPWNAAWDAEVESELADALEATLPDSIPADGTRPSIKQALYMLIQFMVERDVSGTTCTIRKVDGTTALLTLTLNDATAPTSVTRAT